MNVRELFVKNSRKLKACLQENASVVIALCALIVSVYAMYLARQDFIATHRPYVYAISRIAVKGALDLKTVLIGCSNAPARIISIEFTYLVVETEGNAEEIILETDYQENRSREHILHPSDPPTKQLTVLHDFKKKALGLDPQVKFRRKVRIDYMELSSNRTYFFEGNWDYNRAHDLWEDKDMFGN